MVYHRLTLLRAATAALANPLPHQNVTSIGVPSLSLAATIGTTPESNPAGFYHKALGLLERLFDAEIDQANFEEAVRGMFANQGYPIFTLDKLLINIIKLVCPIFFFSF